MEFFEKAHVAKNRRAENKTQEKVKKQLKQMLYGYKQSDTELLKNSAKINSDLDSSSSVSGFSDLDLTSIEDDSGAIHDKSTEISQIFDNGITLDSLSECADDLETLSTGSQESNSNIHDSDSQSVLDSASVTSSITDSNDAFDADGTLASTILHKLGKVRKSSTDRKSKISKIEPDLSADESSEGNFKIPLYDIDEESETSYVSNNTKDLDNEENDIDSSQPYVSVTVNDMPMESLSATIGHYKHPTVRNLPYDNLDYTSGNSGMFSVETLLDAEVNEINLDKEEEEMLDEEEEVFEDEEVLDEEEEVFEYEEEELEKTMESNEIMEIDTTDVDHNTSSQEPNESTSEYDNTLQSETSERVKTPDSIEPQTEFLSPVLVYFAENAVVLIMRQPSEFYILGKVRITALAGSMEIFGYTLQNTPCEVYAPNYNFAQSVKTLPGENEYYGLFGKLTNVGMTVAEAEEILTTLGPEDGVICLESLKSNKLEFIENNFNAADLFTKTNKNVDECFRKACEILGCSLYLTRPWRCFEDNLSWPQVLKCGFDKCSKGIICGGKGLGKSNFLRYYVNNLLSQGPVLVIDLDPGQAELTVAGNVSATVVREPLLGPAFTHLKTPDIMYNVGMISTMDNPQRYLAAVDTLLRHCAMNEEWQDMPWVVNTMGMVNGLGLKFMAYIILQIQPTFVFQIDSKNPKKRFEVHLTAKEVSNLYRNKFNRDRLFRNIVNEELNYKFILSSHAEISIKSNNSLAPRDERYLNFLAYFSKLILSNNKAGLLEVVPYVVNLKDFNIVLNIKIAQDAVCKVLNAKVVALCEEKLFDRTGNVVALNDKPLLCHGHGLIRGIDIEKSQLHIVTAVSMNLLAKVNCLFYADWVPEIRGQEKYLPEGVHVPYRTSTEYQQRQLMIAPKRRFNPVQLIKMSRNT